MALVHAPKSLGHLPASLSSWEIVTGKPPRSAQKYPDRMRRLIGRFQADLTDILDPRAAILASLCSDPDGALLATIFAVWAAGRPKMSAVGSCCSGCANTTVASLDCRNFPVEALVAQLCEILPFDMQPVLPCLVTLDLDLT